MTTWDSILESRDMQNCAVLFSLGVLSGDNFHQAGTLSGVGGQVRSLVRNGVTRARQLSRKALKRRGILSTYNLPNVGTTVSF
jgi:hypothetical protein